MYDMYVIGLPDTIKFFNNQKRFLTKYIFSFNSEIILSKIYLTYKKNLATLLRRKKIYSRRVHCLKLINK